MKATGVIRRIDDLGRVVIPKEIRKNLRIKNGDNLEIYIGEEDNIILKRYNHIDKIKDLSEAICYAIATSIKKDVLITNTNNFIASEGSSKKKYKNKQLSESMIKFIINRKAILSSHQSQIELTEGNKEELYYAISPIIASSDCIGMIIITSETQISEEEFKIIKIASSFLANYIES